MIEHKRTEVDGVDVFYREAGDPAAPAVLLPHGYPCSSFEFRGLMPLLGDRWRLVAPDFPGCGYSATPDDFDYSFDGYAAFLEKFCNAVGLPRFAIYLHDFGSQIGLRLAIAQPDRVVALIVQNGDIYADALGDKYDCLKALWDKPRAERIAKIRGNVTKDEFRKEFLNDVDPALAARIPPDLWELHWALMDDRRIGIAATIIADLKDNLAWFPRYQAYLRDRRPPTLIVWGPQDGYMPAKSAAAYLRDLPDAELHLLDAGHWLLETSLDQAAALIREFLGRVHAA